MIHAIILAAGESSRMGYPKGLLRFSGNETFLEHLIGVYRLCKCKVVIVGNLIIQQHWDNHMNKDDKNVRFILNKSVKKGRMHSVKIGLGIIPKDSYVFIQDVDNPFTSIDILQKLLLNKKPNGYVAPSCENQGGHPVLLGPDVVNRIKNSRASQGTLRERLQPFPRYNVSTTDAGVLRNINTTQDYLQCTELNGVNQTLPIL